MFDKKQVAGFHPILEGVEIKTRVHGEKTLMAEFQIRAGAVIPPHDHPHEQTGMLVSGRMELKIGETIFAVSPGDTWCIPAGIPHEAKALMDSVAIEVFSPLREDYLKWR